MGFMKRLLSGLAVLALLAAAYLCGRHSAFQSFAPPAGSRRILYYVDPMHPSYRSDKPGTAPDCGMQLEPVYAEQPATTADALPEGTVKISLEQQQLIGIRVVEVSKSSASYHLIAPARVVPDDTRTYRVTTGADGVVLSTLDDSVGSLVKKAQVLATFGSPEFLTAESDFLANWLRAPAGKFETASPNQWKEQTLMLAASRLRALGMSEAQVQKLTQTQKLSESIEIAAPVNGVILARNLSNGQRIEKGAELYRIADLSHIWILASLREGEADGPRPGAAIKVSLPDGEKTWLARVSHAVPQLDPATRALQVRLDVDNPGLVLRPDMFVNVDLEIRTPAELTIPSEALLDAGTLQIVYVDHGNGAFEPRRVQTGRHSGGLVEIVAGLTPGEKVVVSGNFLLDSESRLRFPQRAAAASESPVAAASSAQLSRTAKDPSCGLDVDPDESAKAGNTDTFQGNTYYFCSKGCRDKFHANPRALIAGSGGYAQSSSSGLSGAKGLAHD